MRQGISRRERLERRNKTSGGEVGGRDEELGGDLYSRKQTVQELGHSKGIRVFSTSTVAHSYKSKSKPDVMNVFQSGYFDDGPVRPADPRPIKTEPVRSESDNFSQDIHKASYKKMLCFEEKVNKVIYNMKFLKPLRFPTSKKQLQLYH